MWSFRVQSCIRNDSIENPRYRVNRCHKLSACNDVQGQRNLIQKMKITHVSETFKYQNQQQQSSIQREGSGFLRFLFRGQDPDPFPSSQSHAAIAIPESCSDLSSDPFAKRQSWGVLFILFFLNEQKRIRSWQVLQISRVLILSPSVKRESFLCKLSHTSKETILLSCLKEEETGFRREVNDGGWHFVSKEKN